MSNNCFYLAVSFLTILYNIVECKETDCIFQVNAFEKCVALKLEQRKKELEAERDSKTVDGLHCFTANNCEEPTREQIEKNTPPPKLQKSQEIEGPNGDLRRKCFKRIADKIKVEVERCVQEKLASFKFFKKPSHARAGEIPKDLKQGFNFGALFRLINDVCPNDDSKESTKKCLIDSFEETRTDEDRRKEAEEHFNKTCKDKDDCFNKITPACKDEFNDTKKAICECSKSEYEAKKSQYEKEFNQCLGVTNPPEGEDVVPFKSAAYKGDALEFFVTSMCTKKDPCEEGFIHRRRLGHHSKRNQTASTN